MLSSIILLISVAFFAATATHVTTNYAQGGKFLSRVDKAGWLQAVALGLVVGISNYMAPEGLGWASAGFVLMTLFYLYVGRWFYIDIERWREAIIFVLMVGPTIFTAMAASVAGIAEAITSEFWCSFFMTIPLIIATALGGFMISVILCKKYQEADAEEEPRKKRAYRVLAIIAMIATILGLTAQIIWGGISWGSLFPEEKKEVEVVKAPTIPVKEDVKEEPAIPDIDIPESEPEPVEEAVDNWWYFYNTDMLSDKDPKNDFDFGSFLLAELAMENIKGGNYTLEDLANKSVDELIGLVSSEELHYAFWDRLTKDPALGAATAAWLDVKAGTRFLGEFYESCKENWATTMNAAKVTWMQDKDAYHVVLAAMSKFIMATGKSVEIIQVKGGLNDQMYMNPYTPDLIPDIIVMESAEQKGYFLRYTLEIKGKEILVDYRIDCGFQPTNVAKLMKITPKSNPNKPKDTGKTSGGGNKGKSSGGNTGKSSGGNTGTKETSGGGGTTDGGYSGGGTAQITNPKTTDKGLPKEEVVNKNPNTPGPDTNNGVGAVTSKDEEIGNSYYMVEQQYEKAVEELVEHHQNQLVGGDPNTPTTATPSDSGLVDGNANEGIGFGGIDEGVSVHNSTVTDPGNNNYGGSNLTSDDPYWPEWDGPID